MKTRLVSVLASMTLATVALGVAAPANAAPAINQVELIAGFNTIYRGAYIDLSENVPSTTVVTVTVAACGTVIHQESANGVIEANAADGSPRYLVLFSKVMDKSMVGPAVDVTVSFSDPTLPPTSSTAYTHTSYPRSCDDLEPADNDDSDTGGSVTVTKWSTKKGAATAKVGKRLAVTATRAPGAKATYAWKVGAKVVDSDRAMTVKKAYVGKKVTLRITASKTGAKSVSKTLRFGTARG